MVEDFLYICDGAYTQRELIRMEMSILKVVDFDLGIPLSYRFLRRYARVSYLNNTFFYHNVTNYNCRFRTVCKSVDADINFSSIYS